MTTFRWASGDLLAKALADGQEPLNNWGWYGIDPLWVSWLGNPANKRAQGRTLRRLVRRHFIVRYVDGYWLLTRKDAT